MLPKIHKCEDHEIVVCDSITEKYICSICGRILKIKEPYDIFN